MAARGTTHDVRIDTGRCLVTKRYRSWHRGEPGREWAALTLLAESAPGLAPAPVLADLDADPPVIVMSRLPGVPLSDAPLEPAHSAALAVCLRRLWHCVPSAGRRGSLPGTVLNATALVAQVRQMLAVGAEGGDVVRSAGDAAAAWLASYALDRQLVAAEDLVLGQGDSNLANFLWDGTQMRIVDFEDCGPSERAFELANLVEHISAWSEAGLEAGSFLALFDLTDCERHRVREFRRLVAVYWLLLLLARDRAPGRRRPPGALRRQADRVLSLLG